jgi:hypothetical protein
MTREEELTFARLEGDIDKVSRTLRVASRDTFPDLAVSTVAENCFPWLPEVISYWLEKASIGSNLRKILKTISSTLARRILALSVRSSKHYVEELFKLRPGILLTSVMQTRSVKTSNTDKYSREALK